MTFKELLIELNACKLARIWAKDKTIEQVIEECHRNEWLLWLATKMKIDNRLLTLAKDLCANTVRHLMADERSKKAVDTVIAFGKGEVTEQDLKAAYNIAIYNTAVAAAYYADIAACHAINAYGVAYDVTYYAAAACVACDADNVEKNRLETTIICREVLGNELIRLVKERLQK